MADSMTLNELLEFLSGCSGDDALELVHRFQAGGLTIERLGAEDFD